MLNISPNIPFQSLIPSPLITTTPSPNLELENTMPYIFFISSDLYRVLYTIRTDGLLANARIDAPPSLLDLGPIGALPVSLLANEMPVNTLLTVPINRPVSQAIMEDIAEVVKEELVEQMSPLPEGRHFAFASYVLFDLEN